MQFAETFLHTAWVILALPLLTAGFIAMFARSLQRKAWIVGAGAMIIALFWAIMTFIAVSGGSGHEAAAGAAEATKYLITPAWEIHWNGWGEFGTFNMQMGLQVDGLTAVMLVVVTLVSACVQVYSAAYFEASEKRFTRFYAAINLFTTGMLGLVLADNLFLLLVCWEIMGLCSYLLIGHWYEQKWPQEGQIKAFLTTRVGDVGMMIGIFILFFLAKDLTWTGLAHELPKIAAENPALLGLAAAFLFTGAIGKSAQFPLHTWLPDAMAGPTPGSALIHAATMVAAGVYLVGRAFMVYGNAPGWVLVVVAFIGAFTSLFAASIATLRHDIKEVLAYSTISQLGYMIMALGLGGWAAGNFHMMTHAFFKALLFFAAGSVIHAHHHNQLLHKMGGLRKKIPITFWVWMAGYLALAGFPGFSGFFSKDELLLAAFTWHPEGVHMADWVMKLPFIMALLTAFLTAYYMTRATYLAFFGKPRDQHLYDHAHESPWQMWLPMSVLAVLSVISGWGWAALPAHFTNWEWMKFFEHLFHMPGIEHAVEFPTELAVTLMATTAGLGGIVVGILLYKFVSPKTRASWIAAGAPIYKLIRNKYYVDEVYQVLFVGTARVLSKGIFWFDSYVVDGLVKGLGKEGTQLADTTGRFDKEFVDRLVTMWADISRYIGTQLKRLATGLVQQYMLTLVIVVVASVILFQVIR